MKRFFYHLVFAHSTKTGPALAIFAMPQIAAKIQQREAANAQLKLSYQHAMEEEQTEYVERLKSLQDQV